MTRIVFAYDGSAAATAAIAWMTDAWQATVVTLTLDLGQRDELDAVRERALAAGAQRAHVLDVREAFVHDILLPALRAGAACEDGRPLGRPLSRALIARQLIEVARMEATTVVAHGAWRDAADRARLDRALRETAPSFDVRAPLAAWNPTDEAIAALAEARGLRVPVITTQVVTDVWGRCVCLDPRTAEAGVPPGTFVLTKTPQHAPTTPAFVDVTFDRGLPVGINGVTMDLLEIISSLETIAGAHGVGRSEGLEPPFKPYAPFLVQAMGGAAASAEAAPPSVYCIYESPAATVLDSAHHWLERVALPDDLRTPHEQVRALYLDLVRRGGWASVTRAACQAFVDRLSAAVSGTVRVRLSHGLCHVIEVRVTSESSGASGASASTRTRG